MSHIFKGIQPLNLGPAETKLLFSYVLKFNLTYTIYLKYIQYRFLIILALNLLIIVNGGTHVPTHAQDKNKVDLPC